MLQKQDALRLSLTMPNIQDFDPLTCPLEGAHLLEASAGTGKTHHITRIFLRLILEGHPIASLLLLSFSRAATQELRERIRLTLQESRSLAQKLEQRSKQKEDALAALLCLYYDKHAEGKTGPPMELLEAALQDFDDCSIYTLHAFCNKVIEEEAFYFGMLAGFEPRSEDRHIRREALLDFWRRHLHDAPPVLYDFLREIGMSQKQFHAWEQLSQDIFGALPKSLPIPACAGDWEKRFHQRQKDAGEAFAAFQTYWQQHKAAAQLCFQEIQKHKKGRKSKKNTALYDGLEEHFSKKAISVLAFKLEAVWQEFMEDAKQIEHCLSAAALSFYQAWQDYAANYSAFLLSIRDYFFALLANFLDSFPKAVEEKKARAGLLCFDDLITKVHEALRHPQIAPALAKRLRKRYHAVLIDEFQDTDPRQIEIFQKIFAENKGHALFFIGDPKQSIYAFRGADLYAYDNYKKSLASFYSLSHNYRSCKPLLKALHAIYQGCQGGAFGEPPLDYIATQAKRKHSASLLRWEGLAAAEKRKAKAALHLELLSPKDAGTSIAEQEKRIETQLCQEIEQLLLQAASGHLQYKDRALRAYDIAVLVPKRKHAHAIVDALGKKEIPCTLHTEESVFASREAAELLLILQSIASAGKAERSGNKLKAALSTRLWGRQAQEIKRVFEQEEEKQALLTRSRAYRDTWEKKGFAAMFRALLYGEGIGPRLLESQNGERSLTNLLHLSELIQQQGYKSKDIQADMRFLRESIQDKDGSSPPEEALLRLDQEGETVQVMTIHKSKGLEFPIVFAPYLDSLQIRDKSNKSLSFYDPQKRKHCILPPFLKKILSHPSAAFSLGSQDIESMRSLSKQQAFAEHLRLIYVALTRASEKLYVYLIDFDEKQSKDRAATYLFSGGASLPVFAKPKEACPSSSALQQHLTALASAQEGSIILSTKAVPKKAERKSLLLAKEKQKLLRPCLGAQPRSRTQIHSFSSLSKDQNPPQEHEHDIEEKEQASLSPSKEHVHDSSFPEHILSFPRGLEAGRFFHAILEEMQHIGFRHCAEHTASMEEALAHNLQNFGYPPTWRKTLLKHLKLLLSLPLLESAGPNAAANKHRPFANAFRLANLDREACSAEIAFHFILDEKHKQGHKAKQAKELPAQLASSLSALQNNTSLSVLQKGDKTSFLHGFIDLVFADKSRYYILDWKSNFLGPEAAYYRFDFLEKNMRESGYVLQYYIYTDALDRFLAQRLTEYQYESHFGGVLYIYLRGLQEDSTNGIYFVRPSYEEIAAFRRFYL